MSNQVIDLKRSTEESSSSKGPYKPPFRNPFPTNRPNSNSEGLNIESLQFPIQMILEAHDNLIPPKIPEEVAEQEIVEEDEASPNQNSIRWVRLRKFTEGHSKVV